MNNDKTLAELELCVSLAEHIDGTVGPLRLALYPFEDIVDKSVSLAAAYSAQVTTSGGVHTVMLAYREVAGQPAFSLWCGDKFAEGRLNYEDARTRCAQATQPHARRAALADEMMSGVYGKYAPSSGCNFWRLARTGEMCKHVKTFLHHIKSNPNFADELVGQYKSAAGAAPSMAPATSSEYSLEELAFRVPVLYEGDRGAGKTHEARAFARANKLPCVECAGHEGVEAPDLLGFLVPHGQGQMVWKDGPLTEAFRRARTGKTMLLLDEILRIPNRELSILLTAFSPDEGVYRLRTGRIVSVSEDGVASEETLECPVENLCVVATTNVGAEYAVDECDPAMAERFVVLRKDSNPAELKRILSGLAKAKGLGSAQVTQAIAFYKHMVEAMNLGLVKNTPTTRTLARAFELARDDQDVVRGLRSQTLLWVARTSEGKPVPEQVKKVHEMLDRNFK